MSRAWETKRQAADDAVAMIKRGKHIFIGSGAAEPVSLVEALARQKSRFSDNPIVHLLTLGPAPYVAPEYEGHFRHNAFFIGANVRQAVAEGRADYTPVFLSQIPGLIESRRMPVDVALIQTTPPDRFGYVNLGVSVDVVLAAIQAAELVIAEVNPQMPTIFGSGYVPIDEIDAWVEADRPLLEHPPEELDETDREIGRNVASLVEDGATLQTGIGRIPDATLVALMDRRDLGVWTEMFSDRLIDLIENGNITGRHKTLEKGRVSSSFTFGSKRIYEYVDQNPAFAFHPSDWINDPARVARQHKMVAINGALQVDLTGQVSADSIGSKFYSGIGGQVDFIRGASMCPSGKPIIAMRSTAKDGELSRIVPSLPEGAGVVTSRGDVRYVVTEFGIADLLGRSVRERAMALIAISHPDFHGELLNAAKHRRYVFADQISPQAGRPRSWRRFLETEKGKVRIRPIRVTDEHGMQDFFYNLSEETKYKRWMTPMVRMPHDQLMRYLDVDYDRSIAFVAEVEFEGTEPEIVAVGRYAAEPSTDFAEVAFVVRDDWQGIGIGTSLLHSLADFAKERGLRGLSAQVLQSNVKMMEVFHNSGLQVEAKLKAGVIDVRMPFSP